MTYYGLPEIVVTALTVLVAIEIFLLFFMPFFIYRIRVESIRTNRLLKDIAEALKKRPAKPPADAPAETA